MIVRAQQNDTLDLLVWRYLGSTSSIAAVLAINPDIASLGAFLPMGKAINLPDRTPAAPVLQMINLWD
ncbi:tail protein X [Undibacterium sp. Ji42W]|uniref:tail protein X n=1 Tax=Undibacterium sp. Ji42W TaxID=3413039 RepID=UPI003BF0EFF3